MSFTSKEKFHSKDLSYSDLQKRSRQFDDEIGFNVDAIEEYLISEAKELQPDGDRSSWGKALHKGNQTWVGLKPDQLQTTYGEFHEICSELDFSRVRKIVDLGAGYGRLGFVCSSFSDEVHFEGIEFVKERVAEGNRVFTSHNLSNCLLTEGDLSAENFKLPEADVYFIYDFGRVEQIEKVLLQLAELAYNKPLSVVARGRGTQSLIWNNHPWLSQVFDSKELSNSRIFYNYEP
jgi:hypothetical protein